MSKKAVIGVAVAAVVLGAAIYFVFLAGGQTYTVTIDTSCKATPDSVTISPHDQVKWIANDQSYNLLFATSPFTSITSGTAFQVSPTQPASSGGVAASVELQCVFSCTLTYKYSVSLVSGSKEGCPKDPMVIVQK